MNEHPLTPYDGVLIQRVRTVIACTVGAQGNIFGVAWLANTGNRELVTGAMDFTGAICAVPQ